jgi:hypothetical protein
MFMMGKNEATQLCRLRAVTSARSEAVPDAALLAFEEAGRAMERPGAFDSLALDVNIEAIRSLTGFSPAGGEYVSPEAVRRGAEAATPGRTKALGNARAVLRNDYIALGVFLRVCAMHGLGLKADVQPARPRR